MWGTNVAWTKSTRWINFHRQSMATFIDKSVIINVRDGSASSDLDGTCRCYIVTFVYLLCMMSPNDAIATDTKCLMRLVWSFDSIWLICPTATSLSILFYFNCLTDIRQKEKKKEKKKRKKQSFLNIIKNLGKRKTKP